MAYILGQIQAMLAGTWHMLQDASLYIVIGLLAGGLLKVFLSPTYVASHLGRGRFSSVVKAALLGIPLPLCSCGVLPAAAELKKQGANNGATTAFLISTPESGVDSISISWALLDPLMTVFRPLAAFVTALVAGISENLIRPPSPRVKGAKEYDCTCNSCCAGDEIRKEYAPQAGFFGKVWRGTGYAFGELWDDLALPFFVGLLLAGIVGVLVPDTFFETYLGGGWSAMLIMLVFGIPLYICATASTPLAAAFILKGVSPGAVLVFLLVGPATNITSITVLTKILGRRTLMLYLFSIAVVSLLAGFALDQLYIYLGISAQAAAGKAADLIPLWLRTSATVLVLIISVRPLFRFIAKRFGASGNHLDCSCEIVAGKNREKETSSENTLRPTCECSHTCSVPFPGGTVRK